jgi:predicted AAA+ superfamily ATPase
MYFMDTGLLCYLRGIDNSEALERNADSGGFFENYVVSEVYKSFTNTGKRPPLYYYRDANNRKKIDLILEINGVVYPIEIKESTNPDKRATKNFSAITPILNTEMEIGTGSVICNCNDIYPLGDDIWAVPNWLV